MNPFNTLSALLCLFFFSSCQKVIDVNLNDAQPQYVIEAPMFEGVHDFTVRITKTTNYFDTEQPTTVDNAVVVLKDPNSNSVTLTPQGNGWYRIANFAAIPLSSYQLEVFVDGKSFTANSTMPFHTPIDSLTTRKFNGFGPPNPDKGTELLLVHLKDSVGVKNFYRVLITKNDTILNKAENYYIFDDMVRDGLQIDAPIFTSIFKKGDKVDVELLGWMPQCTTILIRYRKSLPAMPIPVPPLLIRIQISQMEPWDILQPIPRAKCPLPFHKGS
ncbi:MAG: DUF4249 domain-containing protein [Bacteroidetes bacterium]|nr:DUF4249 domain-containing protein [Bacteroidota bacterium]